MSVYRIILHRNYLTQKKSLNRKHRHSQKRFHWEQYRQYTNEKGAPKKSGKNALFSMGMIGFCLLSLTAVYYKARGARNEIQKDLEGTVVLVTGGNSGIGFETTKALAAMNGTVVIASRHIERVDSAIQLIKEDNPSADVLGYELDLGSFESIKKFVYQCHLDGIKFDVLINNAGMSVPEKLLTKNGHECHIGINHYGPFLLTLLLLNTDMINSNGRIVTVTSNDYPSGCLDFKDMNKDKNFYYFEAYSTSKLANILFTTELSKRLRKNGSTIQTCSVDPGYVNTKLFNALPIHIQYFSTPLKWLLFKTPEEGSQSLLHCALVPTLKNGGLYSECKPRPYTNINNENDLAKKLWETSEETCHIHLNQQLN